MQKLLVYLFFLIWLGFAIIPKNIMMAFWVGCIMLSFIFTMVKHKMLISAFCINKDTLLLKRYFSCLFILSVIYLFLSFINAQAFWDINNLLFDSHFISRHYLVILELFFPFAFGYLLSRTNFIFSIPNIVLLVVGIYAFCWSGPWSVYLKVASLSLLAFRKKQYWMVFPLFFANNSQSAYMLGWMAMLILTYFKKIPFVIFYRNVKLKLLALFFLISISLTLFYSEFYNILKGDDNTLWRWIVWTNEIDSLIKTCGTGVAFGTAFVTSDIWRLVSNSNMYFNEDGSIYEMLFLVANHNTFLNFFYRMGIFGGLLFISIYIQIIRLCLKYHKSADAQMRQYIRWALVNMSYQTFVILLNPGLEMMQFAISFCVCLSFTISLFFTQNRILINHD